MGKGNNNQQRFQGAAQQQQGQKDEQPKTTVAPEGDNAAAGSTASQSGTDVVQSGASAGGNDAQAGTADETVSQQGTGDQPSGASTEVADAPSDVNAGTADNASQGIATIIPAVLNTVHEKLVQIEEPAPRGSFGGVLQIIEETPNSYFPVAPAAISPYAGAILEGFQEYAEKMNPRRPTTLAQGVSYQRRLFRNLQAVINTLEGEDFDIVFGNFLAMVEENATGAFDELAVFRHLGAPELNLVPTDHRSFRDMLNFILKIAPLKSRTTVAQQVNLDATFAGTAFLEEGRQRVQNYCRIG